MKEPELVYASEANVKIPQMVISFYESKLTWHDSPEQSKSHAVYILIFAHINYCFRGSRITCTTSLVYFRCTLLTYIYTYL